MNHQDKKTEGKKYISALKWTVITFVVVGLLVGFFNAVIAKNVTPHLQAIIHWHFLFFELFVRSLVVFLGAYLTLKAILLLRGEISPFRKISLVSFCLVMLIAYVIIPLSTGFWHFPAVMVPFPCAAIPFQISTTGSYFGNSVTAAPFGDSGTRLALNAFMGYLLLSYSGTFFLGRRWHCSMICHFSGCHAETFGEALPLVTYNKKRPNSKALPHSVRKVLSVGKYVMLVFVTVLILIWTWNSFSTTPLIGADRLIGIEKVKFFLCEVLFMFLLWPLVGSRGYCFYCPAGTVLGMIGRLAGQRIRTDMSKCTGCGLCNDSCKMSIDLRSNALKALPVTSLDCVGCGYCVDACPHGNLHYSTTFLDRIKSH